MPSAAQKSRPWRLPAHGWRRWLVMLAIVVLVLILLPYLLAPFYRVINPVSTLMLWRWATGQRVERIVGAARPHRAGPAARGDRRRGRHRSAATAASISAPCARRSSNPATTSPSARGASTITQQTAKNLFLWQGRSFVRKALELPLALWLNIVLPKRRVMEIYLNIAEWGPNGEFGAEAASRYAFNKPARNLNRREAAELAADPAQSGPPQRPDPEPPGAPPRRHLRAPGRGLSGARRLPAHAPITPPSVAAPRSSISPRNP